MPTNIIERKKSDYKSSINRHDALTKIDSSEKKESSTETGGQSQTTRCAHQVLKNKRMKKRNMILKT